MPRLFRTRKAQIPDKSTYTHLPLTPVKHSRHTTMKSTSDDEGLWTDTDGNSVATTSRPAAVVKLASLPFDGDCLESQHRCGDDGRCCCGGCSLPPWRIMVTLCACVVLEATMGLEATNSCTMPYLASYLRYVARDTSVDYARMLWVGNVAWMTLAAATPLMGLLLRRIPSRLFFFLGFCLFAAAVNGTYWALQTSFTTLILVKGALQGIAMSMLFPGGLGLVLQWFPDHRGLVGGITMAGFGIGAFIWNQVITMWINPDNLQPDLADGENLYFTQAEMLNRVPSCYLMLGGVIGATHLVILVSLTFPPPADHGVDLLHADKHRASEPENTELLATPDYKNYSIYELLTSHLIWILWFFNLTMDFSFIFITSYYKTYGQTFIHNDHLLSLVASLASLCNAFCRPVWTVVADRIGYFTILVVADCILVVTSATFIMIGWSGSAVLYLLWVLIMVCTYSGIYAIQGPMLSLLFGNRNFVFCFGVVNSTGLISTLASIPLARMLLQDYGWAGLFMLASVFNTLGIVTVLSYLTFCRHPHAARHADRHQSQN